MIEGAGNNMFAGPGAMSLGEIAGNGEIL